MAYTEEYTFPKSCQRLAGKKIVLRELNVAEEEELIAAADSDKDGLSASVTIKMAIKVIESFDGTPCTDDKQRNDVWEDKLNSRARALVRTAVVRSVGVRKDDLESFLGE
jgi:hypothetical protein